MGHKKPSSYDVRFAKRARSSMSGPEFLKHARDILEETSRVTIVGETVHASPIIMICFDVIVTPRERRVFDASHIAKKLCRMDEHAHEPKFIPRYKEQLSSCAQSCQECSTSSTGMTTN